MLQPPTFKLSDLARDLVLHPLDGGGSHQASAYAGICQGCAAPGAAGRQCIR